MSPGPVPCWPSSGYRLASAKSRRRRSSVRSMGSFARAVYRETISNARCKSIRAARASLRRRRGSAREVSSIMVLKVSRRGKIPPFIVMDVLRAANDRAATGADVLHLEVGQPSTGAPARVIAAAEAALRGDGIGYTEALGIPSLRQRIALYYRDCYGVAVDPARIVLTTGSSGAFLLAFLAAFEPGDRVALASPSYPAYRNILTALGLVPVELAAGPAERYQASVALLERAPGPLEGLIIASPANPTGTMLAREEIAALAHK